MSELKILGIRIRNFKGFEDSSYDFQNNDVVILGGMNGYGKTGIFDALELLLTGQIKRYKEYTESIDKRTRLAQSVLPLVNSLEQEVVEISATFRIGTEEFELKRSAKVEEMSNPVTFEPFKKLILKQGDGEAHEASDEELDRLGINDFVKRYSFLNYLSQEESTGFLKSKESDRASSISELFDLNQFDEPIKKIEAVSKVVSGQIKELTQRKNALSKDIEDLKKRRTAQKEGAEYIQIATGSLDWDVENPRRNYEQFEMLLRKGGIIDNLCYFCIHLSDFNNYKRNNNINSYFTDSALSQIAFYTKCQSLGDLLTKYEHVLSVVQYKVESASDLIQFASKAYLVDLDGIISIETWNAMIAKISSFRELYESISSAQKELSSLLSLRSKLATQIFSSQTSLPDSSCPLCGHEYENIGDLLKAITSHTDALTESFKSTENNVSAQYLALKNELETTVIGPIVDYFARNGVTAQRYADYKKLDINNLNRKIKILKDDYQIEIDDTMSEADIVNNLKSLLDEKIVELSEDVDYELLDITYGAVAQFIRKECMNIETIEKKRTYLISCMNAEVSELMQEKQKQFEIIEANKGKVEDFRDKLKRLKDGISAEKKNYIKSITTDIQILFYIYSGRIMQNCMYGRGLFVRQKNNPDRILITSSKIEGDEVDALYNMSSGQLVSVSIALILSLNKLYSKVSYIAIDDPVQTIDDINFYGLIETLRHDFKDCFMLLSTHEYDYQELLDYKFRKLNINSLKVDMAKFQSQY
jgi:DNA repair exonuclease SbcCD ATPase subunit